MASGNRQRPADWFDVQDTVRCKPKRSQGRAANFAVLPRSDDVRYKFVSAFSERFDYRREFDRFRASPDDDVAA